VPAPVPAAEVAENPTPALPGAAVASPAEPPPAELALPPRGEIVFTVLRGDPPAIIGRSVQSWELNENSYRITNVMETTGLAALLRPVRMESESRGRIVATGLAPDSFISRRPGKEGTERIDRVEFDWAGKVARFGSGASVPLPEGAQDLLSFNFQLGWLSKTGEMSIATARKLGRYRLELIGEELLPGKLKQHERIHGRMFDWVPAEPGTIHDARHLAKLYCRGVGIADDLMGALHQKSTGSVRRISINLARVHELAQGADLAEIDLAGWEGLGGIFFTGNAPARRDC